MSYKLFVPKKIYIETQALNYPATSNILSKLPEIEPVVIDDFSAIDTASTGKNLLLARQKSDFFKPDNRFYSSCFIGLYSDVIILEGKFHYSLDEKDENITAINDSGIDSSYLDYFTK